MDDGATEVHPAGWRLARGSRVEVRSRFDQHWARGFEVADIVDGAYVIRRVSDGRVLPAAFGDRDVRGDQQPSEWFT